MPELYRTLFHPLFVAEMPLLLCTDPLQRGTFPKEPSAPGRTERGILRTGDGGDEIIRQDEIKKRAKPPPDGAIYQE